MHPCQPKSLRTADTLRAADMLFAALKTTFVHFDLQENYGVTKKIDESLKISDKLALASSKVDELTGSVTDKLSDIKSKASSS